MTLWRLRTQAGLTSRTIKIMTDNNVKTYAKPCFHYMRSWWHFGFFKWLVSARWPMSSDDCFHVTFKCRLSPFGTSTKVIPKKVPGNRYNRQLLPVENQTSEYNWVEPSRYHAVEKGIRLPHQGCFTNHAVNTLLHHCRRVRPSTTRGKQNKNFAGFILTIVVAKSKILFYFWKIHMDCFVRKL